MTQPPLGVMMFSFGGLFWRRQLDLAGALKAVASLGPDQGIELIGAQSLRTYPDVSADEITNFRDLVDETGVVPVNYCGYLERARSHNRVVTPAAATELFDREAALARQLGFPAVRINSAVPSILPDLDRIAARHGVDVVIEIGTEPRTHEPTRELLDALDRISSPRLGLIQDFTAFVRHLPAGFLGDAQASGIPAQLVEIVGDCWDAELALDDALSQVRSAAADQVTAEAAIHLAHVAYGLFRRGDVNGLEDAMPHLRHVQAKFFELNRHNHEPCIPYPALISILRTAGYGGRVHSEFEGFLWSDDLDPIEQIRRHQQSITALWTRPPSTDATGLHI